MSDNMKTLCSSKVSPIRSTHSSADKTEMSKWLKSRHFWTYPLSFTWGDKQRAQFWQTQGIMGEGVRVSPVIYHLWSRRNHAIETGNWPAQHTHTNTHSDTEAEQFKGNSSILSRLKLWLFSINKQACKVFVVYKVLNKISFYQELSQINLEHE